MNAVDRTIAFNNSTTCVTDLNRITVPEDAREVSTSAGGSWLAYRSQQTLINAVCGSVDDKRVLLFDI